MTTHATLAIAKPCQALAMPNVATQEKCKILATRPMILDFRPPTKKFQSLGNQEFGTLKYFQNFSGLSS